jgi:predicted naringenin-chalcone synthase
VDGWAIHRGGRKIVEVEVEVEAEVEAEVEVEVEVEGGVLGLAEEQLAPSYDVLRDVGNCSIAAVLLVLERLAQTLGVPPGGTVVAMAFGPGLTLCTALLRQRAL